VCLSYKLWVTSFSASKMFVSRIEDCFSVLGDFIFIGVRIRAYDLFTIILPGSGRGERERNSGSHHFLPLQCSFQ
jgi:hypothetical protein